MWIQRSGNYGTHNQFYNKWVYGYYVNSMLVFAYNRKIKLSLINFPGTSHDSQMVDYGVYKNGKGVS